jgi:4-amino-4-deoxy-L-arabinose transferase-like glycosyltransferase
VGGLLRLGSLLNLLTLTNDRTYYLDNPADFGRFYIVARAYSAAWGLVAVAAVFALMRRSSGGLVLATIAALCFTCMPVTIDLAHEAKPHLAGVALLLLATLAASNYVRTGKTRWIFWTAAACGAAAAMVLWAVVGLVLIPLTALSRRRPPGRLLGIMASMIVIAATVYFLTNPYVGLHLLHADQRAVLKSNLANTRAMYHADAMSGEANAFRLIVAGTSLPLALAGLCGLVVLIIDRRPAAAPGQARGQARYLAWFVAAVALLMWLQFAAFAGGKPGEYGRFAGFIDVALMLAAVAAVGRLVAGSASRAVAGAILVAATASYSFAYERGFLADAGTQNSRSQAAAELSQVSRQFGPQEHPTLWVTSEPAPYCLPPVDLFRWKIVLLPPGGAAPGGADAVLVKPDDTIHILDPAATPISWADKRFDIIPCK